MQSSMRSLRKAPEQPRPADGMMLRVLDPTSSASVLRLSDETDRLTTILVARRAQQARQRACLKLVMAILSDSHP
jgi:hypothetical protein